MGQRVRGNHPVHPPHEGAQLVVEVAQAPHDHRAAAGRARFGLGGLDVVDDEPDGRRAIRQSRIAWSFVLSLRESLQNSTNNVWSLRIAQTPSSKVRSTFEQESPTWGSCRS